MKKAILLTILFLGFLKYVYPQTFEIYKGDTINYTDKNSLKQGVWIYFYDKAHTKIAKKGRYLDGKKQGIWEEYYPSGKIKSKITYLDNRQNGYAIMFYENGNVSEEGIWRGNRWVGTYKFYHPNGNPAYVWNFNEEGKRTGEQRYYYENGNLMIVGNWTDGKEDGEIKEYYVNNTLRSKSHWKGGKLDGTMVEYYENGSLKAEKKFNNGLLDPNSVKVYSYNTKKQDDNSTKPDENQNNRQNNNTVITSYSYFNATGYLKLYNKQKLVEKEGYFKNGRLIDGKRYFYDETGNIIRTVIYKKGRISKIIDNTKDE